MIKSRNFHIEIISNSNKRMLSDWFSAVSLAKNIKREHSPFVAVTIRHVIDGYGVAGLNSEFH